MFLILQNVFCSGRRTFNNEIKSAACNNVKLEIWSTILPSFASTGVLLVDAGAVSDPDAGVASVARYRIRLCEPCKLGGGEGRFKDRL